MYDSSIPSYTSTDGFYTTIYKVLIAGSFGEEEFLCGKNNLVYLSIALSTSDDDFGLTETLKDWASTEIVVLV